MGLTESSTTETDSTAGVEREFAQVLADIVGGEQVGPDSHFFDDLGANSLLMAKFCARVRKKPGLPAVSMREVYRYPTVSSLAAALTEAEPAPVAQAAPAAPAKETIEPKQRSGTPRYLVCGALQLMFFLAYSCFLAVTVTLGATWIGGATGFLGYYLRSVAYGGMLLAVLCMLPVALKWVLVGRWRPREIPLWSLAYFRFWIVKTLVQRNVLVLFFAGSPLYSIYLRALGARVGRGVTIFSQHVPVCTDLLVVGDGTVIRRGAFLTGYRARSGVIQTGAVTIGKNAFVGEMSALDLGTSLGDGSQLGHTSSLHTGQSVPAGECWHGSPAQRADLDYRGIGSTTCSPLRRGFYVFRQLLVIVGLFAPLVLGGADLLVTKLPQLATLLGSSELRDLTSWVFYRDALIISLVLFFGLRLAGLLLAATIPRLLSLAIKPDKVYPLYGVHYSLHRTIRFVTNAKFFKTLFGDSSAIVHYLRAIGCKLPELQQTGSNFGLQEQFESPCLTSVGSGTMIADGLDVANADYSNTSFRVTRASIGAHNFLGNNVVFPSASKTGDNCLLATKVLVPIDGKTREGVGLLGSPSFEIPRSVERDSLLNHPKTPAELRRRLIAKNAHNAAAMAVFLMTQWFYFFAVVLLGWTTDILYGVVGTPVLALDSVVLVTFGLVYTGFVERMLTLLRPMKPLSCSIYDRRFWRHERFWKVVATPTHLRLLDGTPFKGVALRLMGARVGRRLFDDGSSIPEKPLVTIGDDVALNAGSNIQCHSQEDGGFKLDSITIEDGCTVGTHAWVHYGVRMGQGSELAIDSFLMKGEEVPRQAQWGGNPASEIRDAAHLPASIH
ncbi:Pls/PosA family non-ribosomal peptide synthetase [Amycolatopsis sp. NPDC059021]|uniref:Pls/PosA family non-ribosomal peptide synthetase n=1 Tax=Amycolatopsis sp. NPDC059021 TaxID=3346704 RepID=UPI00366C8263